MNTSLSTQTARELDSRLFDPSESAILEQARSVLGAGVARLANRVPVVSRTRKVEATEQARSAREAITMLMQLRIGSLPHEQGLLALFDAQGRLITIEALPEGDLVSCPLQYRAIARHVCVYGAAAVLLAHNHPSGTCSPSSQDEAATAGIGEWLQALDCALIDHLVFTVDDWCAIVGSWTC